MTTMRRKPLIWFMLSLACLQAVPAAAQNGAQQVQQRINTVLNGPNYQQATWAMLVVDSRTNALALGERIVAVLNEPHEWNGRRAFAPASVGIALGRDAGDAAQLVAHAEAALQKAKREGGATARLYSPAMQTAPAFSSRKCSMSLAPCMRASRLRS